MSNNLSRRVFLRNSVLGASAVAWGTARAAQGVGPNEKVHLAWIGVGGRGTRLLRKTVEECPDARIVAVCDLKPERIAIAQEAAFRDQPKGYTNYQEMFEKEKIDGVVVATEPSNHANLVVPVLEAGYHCLAEKPMDTTVEAVNRIVRAARRAKGFYQIGTQRRYGPGYIASMKVIHGGELGRIIFMQGNWHWSWATGDMTVAKHGGEVIEQAAHHLDVMSWAMKNQAPLSCVAMGMQIEPRPEGPNHWTETHSAVIFQFPGGAVFSYTHLFYLPKYFENEKLWIFCEKGGVDLNQAMLYLRGEEESSRRLGPVAGINYDTGTGEQMRGFVADIKEGGKRLPNANVETGRICTLMCIMGRMAMVNAAKNAFEPRVVKWAELGAET